MLQRFPFFRKSFYQSGAQNSIRKDTPGVPSVVQEQLVIWALFGGGALLVGLLGLDNLIAHAVYKPEIPLWAWNLRNMGTWPGMTLTFGALALMLTPRMATLRPLLWKTSVVVVLSAILGAALLNQVVVKDLADRARPRESVLVETQMPRPDGFKGHSMPSGHAAMGFLLAAPYFTLRRKHPKQAALWLVAGLAGGGVLGFARMTVGAHFLSDVLIAGGINLATSSALAALLESGKLKRPTFARRYVPWAAGVLALTTGGSYMLFNQVSLELVEHIQGPLPRLNLPCPVDAVTKPGTTDTLVRVTLTGYGAPVSNLRLETTDGVMRLHTQSGLYHGLTCTAVLETPQE